MNPDTIEVAKFVLDVVWKVGSVGVIIAMVMINRTKANKATIAEHADKLGDHETRLRLTEQRLDQLPTHEDIEGLTKELSGMSGDLRAVSATTRAIERQVGLIDAYVRGTPK